MNTLKTTEVCHLRGRISWYVNLNEQVILPKKYPPMQRLPVGSFHSKRVTPETWLSRQRLHFPGFIAQRTSPTRPAGMAMTRASMVARSCRSQSQASPRVCLTCRTVALNPLNPYRRNVLMSSDASLLRSLFVLEADVALVTSKWVNEPGAVRTTT